MSIKLEVGKSYRNRAGGVVTIISKNIRDSEHPYFDNWDEAYREDGTWSLDLLSVSGRDLVEEIVTENSLEINDGELGHKPSRYNSGSLEVWDAIIQLNLPFIEGNILKYISRHEQKNGTKDLIKALNYLTKLISVKEDIPQEELNSLTIAQLNDKFK